MDHKIVYQIYPKSFQDSGSKGHGDLKGIISRLDYLQFLGVDVLWLTPIFVSPQNDNGYDVQDYYHVDPLFGSDEDLQKLIDEARKRDMDIMLDMVFNHSSTEHRWFQRALQGEEDYLHRYYFVKEKVNWESKFGGSAFEYVEELDLYYLHLFDRSQADLNWDHPEVFKEFVKICRYWLEKGVRGFRFDVINLISKPEKFEDDHQGDGRRFYTDGKKVTSYLRRLGRESFSQYEDVLTVGELSSTSVEKAASYSAKGETGLSTIFNFHHLKVDYRDGDKWKLQDFDFIALKRLYADWQTEMQKRDASMSLFLNNHDQPRAVSRFTDGSYEGASMLANMIFSMKGVVFIYQGEEIALPNAEFDALSDYRDIETLNYAEILKEKESEEEILKILRERSRDNGRTPMPWVKDHPFYGFSNQEPWLAFSKSEKLKTVEENLKDEESILHYYRHLIAIRKKDPVLLKGSISFYELEHPRLMIYERSLDDKTYLCIHHFYPGEVSYVLKRDINKLIMHNYPDLKREGSKLILRSYESLVFEQK